MRVASLPCVLFRRPCLLLLLASGPDDTLCEARLVQTHAALPARAHALPQNAVLSRSVSCSPRQLLRASPVFAAAPSLCLVEQRPLAFVPVDALPCAAPAFYTAPLVHPATPLHAVPDPLRLLVAPRFAPPPAGVVRVRAALLRCGKRLEVRDAPFDPASAFVRFDLPYRAATPLDSVEVQYLDRRGRALLCAATPLFEDGALVRERRVGVARVEGTHVQDAGSVLFSASVGRLPFFNATRVASPRHQLFAGGAFALPAAGGVDETSWHRLLRVVEASRARSVQQQEQVFVLTTNNPATTPERFVGLFTFAEPTQDDLAALAEVQCFTTPLSSATTDALLRFRLVLVRNHLATLGHLAFAAARAVEVETREPLTPHLLAAALAAHPPPRLSLPSFLLFASPPLLPLSPLLFPLVSPHDILRHPALVAEYLARLPSRAPQVDAHLDAVFAAAPSPRPLAATLWQLVSLMTTPARHHAARHHHQRLSALLAALHPACRAPSVADACALLAALQAGRVAAPLLTPFAPAPAIAFVEARRFETLERPTKTTLFHDDATYSSILLKTASRHREADVMEALGFVAEWCGCGRTYGVLLLFGFKLVEFVDATLPALDSAAILRSLSLGDDDDTAPLLVGEHPAVLAEGVALFGCRGVLERLELLPRDARRRNAVDSLALCNAVSFAFFLIDRHPKNVLFCWATGDFMHIDLTFVSSAPQLALLRPAPMAIVNAWLARAGVVPADELRARAEHHYATIAAHRRELSALLLFPEQGVAASARMFLVDRLWGDGAPRRLHDEWAPSARAYGRHVAEGLRSVGFYRAFDAR